MLIWAGLQAKLERGWKWADCGIDWLNMENGCLTKKVLCGINLFVNVTGAMKLNSYFPIIDLRILL